ncbi:MAG: hypothetical protein R3B45_02595 [Bdellovibrionota bacterium]
MYKYIFTLFVISCSSQVNDSSDQIHASKVSDTDSSADSTADIVKQRVSFLASLVEDSEKESCGDAWRGLTEDGNLDIVIVYGYNDSFFGGDIYALDGLSREMFTDHVTSPCVANYNACGFSKTNDNDVTILKKQITGTDGASINVNIKVTNSSYSFFDKDNRKNRLQTEKSDFAKKTFYDGIKSADIVFYGGHARDGGGPDFDPPRLGKGNHVDYNWYHNNRDDIEEIVDLLRYESYSAKILGIFACSSSQHFERKLHKVAPALGYIVSYRTSPRAVLESSLVGALDAALGAKCAQNFSKSILVDAKYPVRFNNFFHK